MNPKKHDPATSSVPHGLLRIPTPEKQPPSFSVLDAYDKEDEERKGGELGDRKTCQKVEEVCRVMVVKMGEKGNIGSGK
jgi:hypothetical protein